jgi:hypothetical protein
MKSPVVTAEEMLHWWNNLVFEFLLTRCRLGRDTVAGMLKRFEESGHLNSLREEHRADVDRLIDEIFACDDDAALGRTFLRADERILALLLDRVHTGSTLLKKIRADGISAMIPIPPAEFCRRILRQEFRF